MSCIREYICTYNQCYRLQFLVEIVALQNGRAKCSHRQECEENIWWWSIHLEWRESYCSQRLYVSKTLDRIYVITSFQIFSVRSYTYISLHRYSLLGASGCGKTTLLSCVVGVRKLDYGDIWVLGGQPGTEDSGIPGPRIGYMPQDVSLVDEFSVIDALVFFGTISGMEKFEIGKFKKLQLYSYIFPLRMQKSCTLLNRIGFNLNC